MAEVEEALGNKIRPRADLESKFRELEGGGERRRRNGEGRIRRGRRARRPEEARPHLSRVAIREKLLRSRIGNVNVGEGMSRTKDGAQQTAATASGAVKTVALAIALARRDAKCDRSASRSWRTARCAHLARGEATGGSSCARGAGSSLAFVLDASAAMDAAIDLAMLRARSRRPSTDGPWRSPRVPLAIEVGGESASAAGDGSRARHGRWIWLTIARAGDVLIDHRVSSLVQGELHRTGVALLDRPRAPRAATSRRLRGAILDRRANRGSAIQGPHEGHFALDAASMVGREDPAVLLSACRGRWSRSCARIRDSADRACSPRCARSPGSNFSLLDDADRHEPPAARRACVPPCCVRSAEGEPEEIEPELVPARERLLQGEGIPIDAAAAVIAGHLIRAGRDHPAVLLIDDAGGGRFVHASKRARARCIDGQLRHGHRAARWTFAAARGARRSAAWTGARAGAARRARMPRSSRLRLAPEMARSIAKDRSAGRASVETRHSASSSVASCGARAGRSRLGRRVKAYPRKPSSGKGQVMHPSFWIARCAALASMPAQCVLAVVTLAGGELAVHDVERALEATGAPVVARVEIEAMVASGWLVESAPGWIALPTRTHRDAILGELMDEETRHATHAALAASLGATERGLGLADVAFHAARAGDGPRAARLALAAAGTATVMGLASGAAELIALARREDPTCEVEAQRQLASSVASGRAARTSDPGAKRRSSAPSMKSAPKISIPPVTVPEPEDEWEGRRAHDRSDGDRSARGSRSGGQAALVAGERCARQFEPGGARPMDRRPSRDGRAFALCRTSAGAGASSTRRSRRCLACSTCGSRRARRAIRSAAHAGVSRAGIGAGRIGTRRRSAPRSARRPRARASRQRSARIARLSRVPQQIVRIGRSHRERHGNP